MDVKWENVEYFSSNNPSEDYKDMMDLGFRFEDLVETPSEKVVDPINTQAGIVPKS